MPHLQERTFSESRHQLKGDNFITIKKPLNWGGRFYVYYTMKIGKLTSRKREKRGENDIFEGKRKIENP